MSRSIKQLCGVKLHASDGEIGHVKDFYFDDQKWVVRYVVVDTGPWLLGRLVLIAPHAFSSLDQAGAFLAVNLTRQRIENSPPIESHKPVSRQYEEEYFRYYGWPSYWMGERIWGPNAFPVVSPGAFPSPMVSPSPSPLPSKVLPESGNALGVSDPHLRSTRALTGYHLQTREETIGHVTDFIMDDKSWALCHLVVGTGTWFSSKVIAISPSHVDRIHYADSTVFVNLTKETILQAPEYH